MLEPSPGVSYKNGAERAVEASRRLRLTRKVAGAALLFLPLATTITSDFVTEDVVVMNLAPPAVTDANEITVMSANVHSWTTAEGKPGFKTFMQAVEKINPDVLCVQEAILSRDSSKDEVAQLSKKYNLVFATTRRPGLDERFGNFVASKSPIKLEEVIQLNNPLTEEPRNAVSVSVKTTKGLLRITNTHLSVDPPESVLQAKQLDLLSGYYTQIYCGDFNQKSPVVARGTFGKGVAGGRFASYSQYVPDVPTFPEYSPVKSIDHILARCGLVSKPETIDIGSDHLAIATQVAIDKCTYTN